jgi:predicted nucleic acid-binding protein
MPYALVDTGLWYAIFDRHDSYHNDAKHKAEVLNNFHIVLPCPTLYETLRTNFVRNAVALDQFERFLKHPNINYLDVSVFRGAAMELSFESSLRRKRPLSMVDCLLRLIRDDVNTRIGYLATFNVGDFADICRSQQVEII